MQYSQKIETSIQIPSPSRKSPKQVSQASLICSTEQAKSACMTREADWVHGCQPPQPETGHPSQNYVYSRSKKQFFFCKRILSLAYACLLPTFRPIISTSLRAYIFKATDRGITNSQQGWELDEVRSLLIQRNLSAASHKSSRLQRSFCLFRSNPKSSKCRIL
jgi:hypothetical protein